MQKKLILSSSSPHRVSVSRQGSMCDVYLSKEVTVWICGFFWKPNEECYVIVTATKTNQSPVQWERDSSVTEEHPGSGQTIVALLTPQSTLYKLIITHQKLLPLYFHEEINIKEVNEVPVVTPVFLYIQSINPSRIKFSTVLQILHKLKIEV